LLRIFNKNYWDILLSKALCAFARLVQVTSLVAETKAVIRITYLREVRSMLFDNS